MPKNSFAALLCCFWMACSNPFSDRSEIPFIGVWKSRTAYLEPETIAFLSNGRYYENQIRVGTFQVLRTEFKTSASPGLEGWYHTVQIHYQDGEKAQYTLRTTTNNPLEISVRENTSGRGPVNNVIFDKVHTGDGL